MTEPLEKPVLCRVKSALESIEYQKQSNRATVDGVTRFAPIIYVALDSGEGAVNGIVLGFRSVNYMLHFPNRTLEEEVEDWRDISPQCKFSH